MYYRPLLPYREIFKLLLSLAKNTFELRNYFTVVPQTMKTAIKDKIFEISGVGQAPSKDFFSLTVTRKSVIWRSWRITLRSNKSLPSETIQSWHEFINNSDGTRLQGEIRRVFGVETLNHVLSMVTQTWLPYLKSDILVEILVKLDLSDIVRLAQVRYLYLLH